MDILLAFVVLFGLLFIRVPIAFALGLVGVTGFAYRIGLEPALRSIGTTASDTVLTYDFAVLPLFILMGNLIARSKISDELYAASNAWFGHLKGGLAIATIVSCGGFSAVCGSSLATAATMAKVAVPPMRKYGYADSLAAGSVAAGGTLGILIPPSVALIFYGIMTETDIGKLFAAGILPGILGVFLYGVAVAAITRINPALGPAGPQRALGEKIRALKGVFGMLGLFCLVMGGLYFGWFTPTEASGIGAGGAFFIAVFKRTLTIESFFDVLAESGRTTIMLIAVLIGALLFANYMNVARLPQNLVEAVTAQNMAPFAVIVAIVIIYLILGSILESISMMLLTVPVFYPVVASLGYDLIWFGIIVIVVIEISLITPPIGLNVFVLRAVLPDIPMFTIFRGVMPFVAADIVRVVLLLFLPSISLFLPSFMR